MNPVVLPRPVFLTGMMGTGKSTIGKMLAERAGASFTDLDELIETSRGMSIPDIFSRQGEEGFRNIERNILLDHLKKPGAVTALGGGSLQTQPIVDNVKAAGWLIFLECPVPVLAERLQTREDRPMISSETADGLKNRLQNLIEERTLFYSQADITVRTDQENETGIVNRIIEKISIDE